MAKTGGRTTCRGCPRWEEVKGKMRVADLLAKAAENFAAGRGEDFQPSLAEYLKLVQLEREYAEEETKEIKVMWVDPAEQESKKSS